MGKGAIVKMKIGMKQIIESKRMLYGISRAELAAAMQMCERTLGIRLAQPDTFTLKELRVLAKKPHSTVAELIGETQCA